MSYAYVRSGPKAEALLMGHKKIEFARAQPKSNGSKDQEAGPSGSNINLELEGSIGQLQNNCYHDLVQACKDIAASVNVNQWTNIMGVQVN